MKLVKLVYMSHGWNLAVLDRPLITDEIEAWDYGPVIPGVYYTFRVKGEKTAHVSINEPHDLKRVIDPETVQLLVAAWDRYKDYTAIELSNLTHAVGGPWYKTYEPKVRYRKIANELIKKHYKKKHRSP